MHATETYALVGLLSLGVLSLLHALVWRAQREPWAAHLAAGFGLAAVAYSFDAHLQPEAGRPNAGAAAFAYGLAWLTTRGLALYFGLRAPWVTRLSVGVGIYALIAVGLTLLDVLTRLAAFTLYGVVLTTQALLAVGAMRAERDSGHGLVATALLTYPLLIGAAALGWFEVSHLRYLLIAPHAVTGATVLTTGLLRAQRRARDELQRRQAAEHALQQLNASLEQRVAQRTAELHEVVGALESFNRSVSHDLRGPLGGIAGVSRLAREALDRHDTASVARMLDVITAQADSSAKLVAALLALARVNDAPVAPQPVDLQAFVRDTLERMRQADPGGVAPTVTVQDLPRVQADPDLLRQVVVNPVANAVKFTRDQHPPQIEVGALRPDAARPHERVLYVRDNGVGFDMNAAGQLFEPFERLHDDAAYQGHGIGLSIVKRIVERHGGKVWAESARDQGATFYFSLPVTPA